MTKFDNPARRLYCIFEEALKVQENRPLREVWAQVFFLNAESTPENLSEIFIRLAKLIKE